MKNKLPTKRFAFAKEITIVACVKVVVLATIWAVFFREPLSAKIHDTKKVSHLLAVSIQHA